MTDPNDQRIARINELSVVARTSWIGLLAYLAYIGITLLAVEDADFFVPSRQTELPIIGIAIPTFTFFAFAPPLAAALYIYLHIHLLKLWDAIADAPARPGNQPLGEHLHPWIANDYALALKGDRALRPRPLRRLSNLASLLLVWMVSPLVVGGFWWRSMPAHELWLTLSIAVTFLLSIYVGATSWRTARARLSHSRAGASKAWWWVAALVLFWVSITSWLRTEHDLVLDRNSPIIGRLVGEHGVSTLAAINLSRVQLVPLPPDWRPLEVARLAFRQTWCQREELPMTVCGQVADLDMSQPDTLEAVRTAWCRQHGLDAEGGCAAYFSERERRFRIAWAVERNAMRGALPKLDLRNADLRRATAWETSLVGADLSKARLKGANFMLAELEGADLYDARMEGANLVLAGLEGAMLMGARMDGANLTSARLQEAMLTGAQLQGANLEGAHLQGANLTGARLQGANLAGARLQGAVLGAAQMDGAIFTDAQMEGVNLHAADLRGSGPDPGTTRKRCWRQLDPSARPSTAPRLHLLEP